MTERMALCVDGPLAGKLYPIPSTGFIQYDDPTASLPLTAKPTQGVYHLARYAFRVGDLGYTFPLLTVNPDGPSALAVLSYLFSEMAGTIAQQVDLDPEGIRG
jgi:hypothetical protein